MKQEFISETSELAFKRFKAMTDAIIDHAKGILDESQSLPPTVFGLKGTEIHVIEPEVPDEGGLREALVFAAGEGSYEAAVIILQAMGGMVDAQGCTTEDSILAVLYTPRSAWFRDTRFERKGSHVSYAALDWEEVTGPGDGPFENPYVSLRDN